MAKTKNKDFQKIKFKVGKKIQKNTNDTKAVFKAKTLVIKQQFKEEKFTTSSSSQKNQTLKEIFAHLGHYNQTIKLEALNNLREEISKNPDLLKYELSNILENLCPLFSDKDYKVRGSSMEMFRSLVLNPNVSRNNSLEPFFHQISVHLCCAMTHIVETIQDSSLKLLDILIDNKPDFIRAYVIKILENFIDQISKAGLKGKRRILKNDPHKFTSTHVWRKKVLNRLSKMLTIVVGGGGGSTTGGGSESGVESNEKLVDFGGSRQCLVQQKIESQNPITLNLTKRTNTHEVKDLNESKGIFKTYVEIIVPLLADCWIEAKPENNTNVIDDIESLNIMHSVLSIYDAILDNLGISVNELSKYLSPPKHQDREKYLENFLLKSFPYILSDNFDYTESSKSANQQMINSNTINLLLCKIFSSSLLLVEEESLFAIFEYCLNVLKPNRNNNADNNLSKNELNSVFKIYDSIFKNFSNQKLIEPFLGSLIAFHEETQNSSQKWQSLQLLCKNFAENDNLLKYESPYLAFYKKSLCLLIGYLKEKNEDKAEFLLDWIRKTIIRKGTSQNLFLKFLNDQYINILSSTDFESPNLKESLKKKVIELIFWLPKINQYLLTKLAIMILFKNMSFFLKTEILSILKLRIENEETDCIEHRDYLKFLLNLFNGYLSFDILNKNNTIPGEFLIMDLSKFEQHKKLCQYLEEFVSSHKSKQELVELLISTSTTILARQSDMYCSTLYGNLCLVGQISSENIRSSSSCAMIIDFIESCFRWTMTKKVALDSDPNQIRTDASVYTNMDCVNDILSKILEVFDVNQSILKLNVEATINEILWNDLQSKSYQ